VSGGSITGKINIADVTARYRATPPGPLVTLRGAGGATATGLAVPNRTRWRGMGYPRQACGG